MAHAEESHAEQAHGSVKEYVNGLILSFALTAIPFVMVMLGMFSPGASIAVIMVCAIAQILVQLVFFLHMNLSAGQQWNVVSAVLVVILVAILIVGSIWVMQHMNHNMLMGH